MAAGKRARFDADLTFMPDAEWPELAGKPAPRADSLPSEVATAPGVGSEIAPDAEPPEDAEDARPTLPVPPRKSVPPGDDVDVLLDISTGRKAMPTLSDEHRETAPTMHDHDPLRHDLPGLDEEWGDE